MDIASDFLRQSSLRYSRSFHRINHAVRQLDDRQFWHRLSAESDSVAIVPRQQLSEGMQAGAMETGSEAASWSL
jgi:hypothetical protein